MNSSQIEIASMHLNGFIKDLQHLPIYINHHNTHRLLEMLNSLEMTHDIN